MKTIHWGIMSTGNIANEFLEGLADLPATKVTAVGSRSLDKANAFADKHAIPNRYGSYEALVQDPDVNVIYIGTPHPFHEENSLLCLNAGKAALCEKPFALNLEQAQTVVKIAREKKLFMMEAVWTVFLPHIVKLREIIETGAIGEVRMLQADFGFRIDFDPGSRLFDPSLGGGSLLDVGLYPLILAQMLFGPATQIKSFAQLGQTGVDEEASLLLRYAKGQTASLISATRLQTPNEAFIMGTEGRIHIPHEWWRPNDLILYKNGQRETVSVDCPLPGHNYEALEVNKCLRADKTESDTMPLDATLSLMQTLDEIRSQWGLRYPGE